MVIQSVHSVRILSILPFVSDLKLLFMSLNTLQCVSPRQSLGFPACSSDALQNCMMIELSFPICVILHAGVQSGAGQIGRGIAEGPRQIQAILARLQARMEEQRLQASLQAERDSPVDVQVGQLRVLSSCLSASDALPMASK